MFSKTSKFRIILGVLAALFVLGVGFLTADLAEAQQPETPGESGDPGVEQPEVIKIVPPQTRVLVGKTRQFRIAGRTGTFIWGSEDPEVGTIDENGLFTALMGGVTVITATDGDDNIWSTGEIVVMGGPTKIHPERGGRAFSADDTLVTAQFPPQASERAVIALIEKRGEQDLPPQAKGRGRIAAVFDFSARDAETGEDVGGKGFKVKVSMTLHYNDEGIPEGVDEDDLVAARLNEETGEWERVPAEAVVEFDTEENTITIEVESFSTWAVVDESATVYPTAVRPSSWGEIKSLLR